MFDFGRYRDFRLISGTFLVQVVRWHTLRHVPFHPRTGRFFSAKKALHLRSKYVINAHKFRGRERYEKIFIRGMFLHLAADRRAVPVFAFHGSL